MRPVRSAKQVIVFSKRGRAKGPPAIYDAATDPLLAVGSLAAFTGAAAARQFTESTDKSSEKEDEDSSEKEDEIEKV
jgi:hypothetical protein